MPERRYEGFRHDGLREPVVKTSLASGRGTVLSARRRDDKRGKRIEQTSALCEGCTAVLVQKLQEHRRGKQ